ncbi:hypothetical protein DIPPA_33213 [Diplonema papillatum]|nr:hypothetical protein DIPPA_33213 [Diplonema papillatum]|eukprot:gene18605-28691_t
MVVTTKAQRAASNAKHRGGTQTHVLRDGSIMQSADSGILAACKAGDLADVQRCLEGGADVVSKTIDRHGSTALHWAAGSGHLDICQALVTAVGDSFTRKRNKDGRNALHWAARNGHVPVVAWLLDEAHADIDAATHSGNTALHWAIWGGQLDMCRYLIDRGADLHIENQTNCTAVHWAAAKGSVDICRFLHSLGADFRVINSAGHGCVTKAAWPGHEELVFWLLESLDLGYQLELVDVHGLTTKDLAEQNGHELLAERLREWEEGKRSSSGVIHPSAGPV